LAGLTAGYIVQRRRFIMFGPGRYSESDVLVGFLDAQLASVRAAAFGLTDQQARRTPCRSSLSVGGLIKHATYVMEQYLTRRSGQEVALDEAGFALFLGSFTLGDETLDRALARFDDTRARYLDDVRGTDPGARVIAPAAPWDGVDEPTESVARFELLHHVEEFARHAGHADIVREQVDGANAASLLMAVEGRAGNDFVQPWAPSST
jgi:Protein of unknown function (DUF664)